MKKLSNLMYVLGIGSLTLSISCGSNQKDEVKKSPEVATTVAPKAENPVVSEVAKSPEVTEAVAPETPAEATKSEEDLAQVVPTQESIDSFSSQLANNGAVAGLVIGSAIDVAADSLAQGSEVVNLYIETTGDLTIREILEQNGQNFNDYVKTPAGYVFKGTQSIASSYFSNFLSFYGLNE